MGLNKLREVDGTGATGNYWRIIQLNINYDRLDVITTIVLYRSKEFRLIGKSPFPEEIKINLAGEFLQSNSQGEDTLKNITLQKAYQAIKKMAQDEMSKPISERNQQLAWFYDVTDE